MPVCVCTLGAELESFPIFGPSVSAMDRNIDLFWGDSSDSTYPFLLDQDALCSQFHGGFNAD